MNCKSVRAHLLDFVHDETGPLRSWVIRRHLAACADCAEELAALRQFTAALRRADLVPPEAAPLPMPRRAPLRRVLAAAVAVLLVGGLLLLPTLNQNRRNAQNPGAAIAAALGRVNTWHFSGWKLIDGQKVPWDVWGRRTPWLYYERVGDTITWSAGKQRVRVFAPNLALKRPNGLTIKTSEDQAYFDLGFLEDPAYQTLVNSRQSGADFGDGFTSLYQQTSAVARFRRQNYTGMSGVNENKLYTISKRDWLPMTYQLHFENRKFARDTEYLRVRYEVDLPDGVIRPPSPDGYRVIDFTQPAKAVIAPVGSIAESHGFRVQAEPAGMDKAGNIMIVTRGWLGENRLREGSAFRLNVSPFDSNVFGVRQEKRVRYLYASNFSVPPSDDVYLPYIPLEPSKVSRSLPDSFQLSLSASPQVLVRSSDQLDANGGTHPVTRTESLMTETFWWRLPLPRPIKSLSAAVPLTVGPRFRLPSERDLCDQRRIYYNLSYDFQGTFYEKVLPQAMLRKFRNPDGSLNYYRVNAGVPFKQLDALQSKHLAEYKAIEQGFRRRAVYWQERKIAALSRMQDVSPRERHWRRQDDTFLLAKLYKIAGDPAGMKRTLRRLIEDTRTDPALGILHRQAQYMLRTGQFPTDANYKGPA